MAHDSLGPQNQPVYSASGAPADAADLTEVAQFASDRARRRADLSSVRTALTGADLVNGVEFFETDTQLTWLCTGTGWEQQSNFYPGTTSGATIAGSSGGTLGVASTATIPSSAFSRLLRVEAAAIATVLTGQVDFFLRLNGTNTTRARVSSTNQTGILSYLAVIPAGSATTVQLVVVSTAPVTVPNDSSLAYIHATTTVQ
jgi:hypothetical protein